MPIVTSGVVVSIIAMSMVLGEDMYQLVEEEKAKEETEDEEREVESMIVM